MICKAMFSACLRPQYSKISKTVLTATATYCTPSEQYVYPKREDEYTKTPQYPPIKPDNWRSAEERELQKWYDKIKRMKTIEEKIIQCNMPRYYGWKCLLLREGVIPFDSLEFVQYITRTHLIKTPTLPEYYNKSFEECSQLVQLSKSHIQNAIREKVMILKSSEKFKELDESAKGKELTNEIVNELNNTILKVTTRQCEHLQSSQVDYLPRIESFWYLGSLTDTYVKPVYKEGIGHEPEEYNDRPSDKYIQYIGNPVLQLRLENPLSPLIMQQDANYFNYSVPTYKYDPFVVFDYELVRRHVTSIPGFWPGESREFSLLSYHDTSHINNRPETYGVEEGEEALQCHAILSSFAWLMSLASFQGFTTFHDNTYPFVTQTVLTDGKQFTFAVYQLNTTELHHKDALYNPRCNICWITPTMQLYESIENGEMIGFNEGILQLLFQFYLNEPEDKRKCIRKPYLDSSLEFVANYGNAEQREWLERQYKFLSSNRQRHRLDQMYEVADYERIYKIQFHKLVRDKRCRPFELQENPYHRRLDDHNPKYIPKADRTDKHLPKWRQQKYKKTYYPE